MIGHHIDTLIRHFTPTDSYVIEIGHWTLRPNQAESSTVEGKPSIPRYRRISGYGQGLSFNEPAWPNGPYWAHLGHFVLSKIKAFSRKLPVPSVLPPPLSTPVLKQPVSVWEETKRLIILRSLIFAGTYSPEGGVVFPKGSWPFGLESFRIPRHPLFWLKAYGTYRSKRSQYNLGTKIGTDTIQSQSLPLRTRIAHCDSA